MAISTTSITESINKLISAYRTQLRQPLRVLQARRTVYGQVNSALSIMSDYLSILQDLSTPLKKTGTDSVYYAKAGTSSDTTVVTATAANEAAVGVHTISISQLAKNYTQISNEYTSTEKKISGDPGYLDGKECEFKIMINGVTTDISVAIGDDTDEEVLLNIAEAINSSDAKVNATVIHQTSSKSRLILTAEETGNEDTVLIKDTSETLATTIGIQNAGYNEISATKEKVGTTIRTDFVGTGDCIFSVSVNGITRNITVNIGDTDTDHDVLNKIMEEINKSDVSKTSAGVLATLIEIHPPEVATHEYIRVMNSKIAQDSTHYVADDEDISPETYVFTMYVRKDGETTVTKVDDIQVIVNAGDTNSVVLGKMETAINNKMTALSLNITASVKTDDDEKKYLQIVSDNEKDVFSIEDKTLELAETIKIIGKDLFSVEDISDPKTGKTYTLTEYITLHTTDEKTDSSAGYIYKDTELNSEFILNELQMERTSNTVSDAVTGITLNLLKVQTSPDVTIQVSNNVADVKATVNSFIDQYNSVLEYLYSTTRTTQTGDEKFETAVLSEEYFYKDLTWKLRELMAEEVTTVTNTNYELLFNIGITADTKGKLSISDSSKFENALSEDITNVSDLFNTSEGKAVKLYDFLENYIKVGGYIDNSENAHEDRIEYLDARISRMEASINRKLAAYRKSLGVMQEMMAMLQGQYTMLMMYYGLSTGTSTF